MSDKVNLKKLFYYLFFVLKVSEVRLCCLNTLLPLYENVEVIGRLELFTNKFINRLVSMVRDTEIEAATKACQLLTLIYR